MKNVFFFYNINDIGGVETMFWELAKKYHKAYDITIYYKKADRKQLERLRRYVNVIQYTGQQIECEHAFFNYDTEPFIGNVKAKRYYQIIHADFKLQRNIKIRIDPKIDTYIAVSKSVADSFYEMCGVKCEVCPNPLTLEKIENPPFFLCAAQRMTSEKGKNRIFELINRLDKLEDFSYYFLLFTNQGFGMTSPNLVAMPSRLDVRPYIFGCDLFVALSDSEGRCYSVGEKLGYGTGHLLITPCPSFFEQGANDQNAIVMEFDMSNMDEVINDYKNALDLLDDYDHKNIVKPKGTNRKERIEYRILKNHFIIGV